jgi:hypothetical protein
LLTVDVAAPPSSNPGAAPAIVRLDRAVRAIVQHVGRRPVGSYHRDLSIYALDDYSRTKHVMHNIAR